jgi:predicted nucleotidyltransferase
MSMCVLPAATPPNIIRPSIAPQVMVMKPEPLFSDTRAVAELCERHGIARLALFGSQLKGTARPDSDVDLLVEFRPGRVPGFLGMAQIEDELSRLLGDRRVDLRTAGDLSRYFREEVIREAIEQYAA